MHYLLNKLDFHENNGKLDNIYHLTLQYTDFVKERCRTYYFSTISKMNTSHTINNQTTKWKLYKDVFPYIQPP